MRLKVSVNYPVIKKAASQLRSCKWKMFGIFAYKLRVALSANCILFMTIAPGSLLAQLARQLAGN